MFLNQMANIFLSHELKKIHLYLVVFILLFGVKVWPSNCFECDVVLDEFVMYACLKKSFEFFIIWWVFVWSLWNSALLYLTKYRCQQHMYYFVNKNVFSLFGVWWTLFGLWELCSWNASPNIEIIFWIYRVFLLILV